MSASRPLAIVLLAVVTMAASAESPTRSDVALAKQRFESSAAGIKRLLSTPKVLSDDERGRLAAVQFSFDRSPLPVLRHDRRFGEMRVVMSVGWITLAEELLRAEALSKPDCFRSFAPRVLAAVRDNRQAASEGARQRLRAVPRLSDHIEDNKRQRGSGCAEIGERQLRHPTVNDAVTTGLDATLFWSISREIQPLLASGTANMTAGPCDENAGDQAASKWARLAGIDLAPGASAVLLHAALSAATGCASSAQRFEEFMKEWVPEARQAPLRAALAG